MKISVFLLAFVILLNVLPAVGQQNINIDSLFANIKPDTASVDYLGIICIEICRDSKDTGIILGEKSLEKWKGREEQTDDVLVLGGL